MTNLEKIKQMSAEEFTEWFQTQIDKHFKYEKVYCKATDPDFYNTPNWDCLKHSCYNCKECIIDYFNRDAKTEDQGKRLRSDIVTNFEKWRKKLSEATNAYNFMSVIEAMTLEFGESNKSIPFSDWRFTEWLKQEAETETED